MRATPAGEGLDALTGEFGDLIAQGVIDPVRVTRLALQHAASVADLIDATSVVSRSHGNRETTLVALSRGRAAR